MVWTNEKGVDGGMSRLTKYEVEGVNVEELGYTPCKDYCKIHECSDCAIQRVMNKLAHYEDLEEQGRLIEVRLGHWRYMMDEDEVEYLECPLCGGIFYDGDNDTFDVPYNHCPNCGAKLAELKGTEE